jgi:hypothetical protein
MSSNSNLSVGGASKRSFNLASLQGAGVLERSLEQSAELAGLHVHPLRLGRVSYMTEMVELVPEIADIYVTEGEYILIPNLVHRQGSVLVKSFATIPEVVEQMSVETMEECVGRGAVETRATPYFSEEACSTWCWLLFEIEATGVDEVPGKLKGRVAAVLRPPITTIPCPAAIVIPLCGEDDWISSQTVTIVYDAAFVFRPLSGFVKTLLDFVGSSAEVGLTEKNKKNLFLTPCGTFSLVKLSDFERHTEAYDQSTFFRRVVANGPIYELLMGNKHSYVLDYIRFREYIESASTLSGIHPNPLRGNDTFSRIKDLTVFQCSNAFSLFLRGDFAMRGKSGRAALTLNCFVRPALLHTNQSNDTFFPFIEVALDGISWMLCAIGGPIYEGCLREVILKLNLGGQIGSDYCPNVVHLSLSLALEEIGSILSHNGTDVAHPLYRVEFNSKPLIPESSANLVKKVFVDKLLGALETSTLDDVQKKYPIILKRYGLDPDDPRLAKLMVVAQGGVNKQEGKEKATRVRGDTFCTKDLFHLLSIKTSNGGLPVPCPHGVACDYLHPSSTAFKTWSKAKKIASVEEHCLPHVVKKVAPVLHALK